MPNDDDLLTAGEAARRLQVSIFTVRRWADAGKLPHLRSPSGHRRFRSSDVDAALIAIGAEATA